MYRIKIYLSVLFAVFILSPFAFSQGFAEEATEADKALDQNVQAMGVEVNQALKNAGKKMALHSVEIYSTDNMGGQEVLINDLKGGLQKIGSHWVANDERRALPGVPGDTLTYAFDRVDGAFSGTGADGSSINIPYETVAAAFEKGVNVWRGVHCRNNLKLLPKDPGTSDLGLTQLLRGWGGGSFDIAGDIQFGGFMPSAIFNQHRPGGADFVTAVTYGYVFIDDNGNPTDINNDGLNDLALKEIYFNNKFPYCVAGSCTDAVNKSSFQYAGATFPVTYRLDGIFAHEFGHGLSLDHFNKISVSVKDGSIKVVPDSLMSTYQPDPTATLKATDNASYCKTWNSWPNN
jgi:hypothetical protein